jgi:hypothetical protein
MIKSRRARMSSIYRNQPRAEARFAKLLADPGHQAVGEHAAELRRRLDPYLPAGVAATGLHGLGVEPSSQAAGVLLYVAGPYVRRRDGWLENTSTSGQTHAASTVETLLRAAPRRLPKPW